MIYAIRTDDDNNTLIIQFENVVDARGFVHIYSCSSVQMYVIYEPENPHYSLFTHLPNHNVCLDIIELYTGVRL